MCSFGFDFHVDEIFACWGGIDLDPQPRCVRKGDITLRIAGEVVGCEFEGEGFRREREFAELVIAQAGIRLQ